MAGVAKRSAYLLGYGLTAPGKTGLTATDLAQTAFERALAAAQVRLRQIQGLISVPSLAQPRFMEAHYLATRMGLLPSKGVVVRTIDTGGAGPVSGLLEADFLIKYHQLDVVAIVAADAVSSLPTEEFLRRADAGCADADSRLRSPVIPHGYDRVATWALHAGTVTRDQLAMVAVLMSHMAARHPLALTRRPLTLDEVLNSPRVADATQRLECARRADGGAALIVVSDAFLARHGPSLRHPRATLPRLIGGGEASGPLFPPRVIDEEMFSCEEAVTRAYRSAGCDVQDIDFFGLYDCFPICFVRALEAVGLAAKGAGGAYVEQKHALALQQQLTPTAFPINTHGGLLGFGAPWEVPAMYNIIEAMDQLNHIAGERQVPSCQRALVYGNGGIFSASAVAILERAALPTP